MHTWIQKVLVICLLSVYCPNEHLAVHLQMKILISIRRPSQSQWLLHHLLNSFTADLWDESRQPQRLGCSWLIHCSSWINRKVLQLLTQVQFNSEYWCWKSQQSACQGKRAKFWPGRSPSAHVLKWNLLHIHTHLFMPSLLFLNNEYRYSLGARFK